MNRKLSPVTTTAGTRAAMRDLLSVNWVHSQKPNSVIAVKAMMKPIRGNLKIPKITRGAKISAVIILCFKLTSPY